MKIFNSKILNKKNLIILVLIIAFLFILYLILLPQNTSINKGDTSSSDNQKTKITSAPNFFSTVTVPQDFSVTSNILYQDNTHLNYIQTISSTDSTLKIYIHVTPKSTPNSIDTGGIKYEIPLNELLNNMIKVTTYQSMDLYREDALAKFKLAQTDTNGLVLQNGQYISFSVFIKDSKGKYIGKFKTQNNDEVEINAQIQYSISSDQLNKDINYFDSIVQSLKI